MSGSDEDRDKHVPGEEPEKSDPESSDSDSTSSSDDSSSESGSESSSSGTSSESSDSGSSDEDSDEEGEDEDGDGSNVDLTTSRVTPTNQEKRPPIPPEVVLDQDGGKDDTDADADVETDGETDAESEVDEDDVLDLPVPDKDLPASTKKEEMVPLYRSGPLVLGKRLPKMWMTKYERARIIGTRATQLVGGMPDRLRPEERDQVQGPIARAKLELLQRETPFIIQRTLPNGEKELITVQEMQ